MVVQIMNVVKLIFKLQNFEWFYYLKLQYLHDLKFIKVYLKSIGCTAYYNSLCIFEFCSLSKTIQGIS